MVKPKYATEGTEKYRQADEKRRAMEMPDATREEMARKIDGEIQMCQEYLDDTSGDTEVRIVITRSLKVWQAIRSLIEKHGGKDG